MIANETTRAKLSPSVYARDFGGELVLLEFGRGEYFALDEIGALVWRQLEDRRTLGEVTDAIVARHEVGREQALRDVLALVTHMQDQGLLSLE